MQYRTDINGLRAIAVLPVLFFHAGWSLFSGGYLGVDVFFVISGFLITSMIVNELREGTFQISDFYNRRIRRIMPAMLVVVLLSTIASFFCMLPYDLKNYGQSLVATMLSANNILLFLTSGYWSIATEFKPLFHTWSLGVEEQFYFIIPILLLLTFKISAKKFSRLLLLVTGMLVVSFFISALCKNDAFNFLMIVTRTWELSFGSLIAVIMAYKNIKENGLLSLFGLLLILISYFAPTAISSNQAIFHLIPVIGTCLIIFFGSNKNITGKLLSVKPFMFVGMVSYSVYLLHQPLLAFVRLTTEGAVSTRYQLVCALISIPLAFFVWKYVETPCRCKITTPNARFYPSLIASVFLFTLLGLVLHKTYGFQHYFSNYSYGVNPQAYADKPYSLQSDKFPNNNKKNLLVIGNSFARDFINMMNENDALNAFNVVYLFSLNQDMALSKKLLAAADISVYVSSSGMERTLNAELAKVGAKKIFYCLKNNTHGKVLFVGTKNFGWNNNFFRQFKYQKSIQYRVKPKETAVLANKIEKNAVGAENYIDVMGLLTDKLGKVPLLTKHGRFISFDTNHITKDGAAYLGHILLAKSKLKVLHPGVVL